MRHNQLHTGNFQEAPSTHASTFPPPLARTTQEDSPDRSSTSVTVSTTGLALAGPDLAPVSALSVAVTAYAPVVFRHRLRAAPKSHLIDRKPRGYCQR